MIKFTAFIVIGFLLFSSGCHSLRKKFIRKKKYKNEAPVYVDFKEYPTKPPKQIYSNYYLFVRGWLDELIGALNKGESFKREKRAINEAIMNLEQIISFYNSEGREQIYPLYSTLVLVKNEIDKYPNMPQMKRWSLIRKIEYFKRRFEADFNYPDAEKWMD